MVEPHHELHGKGAATHHEALNHSVPPREVHEAPHFHSQEVVADLRARFWASLTLTIPILLLSPSIRDFLRLEALAFPGDRYVLLCWSSVP